MPLPQRYDAALCDLDGVLHLGEEPVEHAAAAVAAARAAGLRVAYVTNNASRAPAAVAQKLTRLGIPAESEEVVTSAQAAARALAAVAAPGAAVLVVGTQALADEVTAAGLRPVRTVAEAGEAGPADVVQGLAPTTSWADLAEAAVALHRGALWVAGNTDATLPTTRGPLPGNGAFVGALRLVTGREPVVAGKPDPALHHESVERVGAQRPLVVGDRLDTDVLGAVRGGADSLLVLTGVVGVHELLHAPAGSRPTYLASDLRGLLQPHPRVEIEVEGGTARCRGARAVVQGELLHLEAQVGAAAAGRGQAGSDDGQSGGLDEDDGSGDDGLRALAALAWSCADQGRAVRLAPGRPLPR